ncbi:MAG: histidine kinase [Bifidobacteriaceae bacterium]|nr:histidine kinase [Bifidobacteriaceae bacterium]
MNASSPQRGDAAAQPPAATPALGAAHRGALIGRIGRWFGPHPYWTNGILIAAYAVYWVTTAAVTWANPFSQGTAGGLAWHRFWTAALGGGALRWAALASAWDIVAMCLFRRRHPVVLLVLTGIAEFVSMASVARISLVGDVFMVLVALWSVAHRRTARTAWIGGVVLAATGVGAAFAFDAVSNPPLSATLIALLVIGGTAVCVALATHQRYVAALEDEARALAAERDQRARLAVIEERGRIASEMHDIVGHSLSVIAVLSEAAAAQAATLAEPPGPTLARAMDQVADTARTSIGDIRRLVAALRTAPDGSGPGGDSPAAMAPQPGAADLTGLVAEFRRAGLPVELVAPGPLTRDPGLGLTIYRIVEESLTNALRYAAGPTRVVAAIGRTAGRPGTWEVTVTDDGGAADAGRPAGPGGHLRSASDAGTPDAGPVTPGGGPAGGAGGGQAAAFGADRHEGQGIIGMRQRVAVYGGTLEAGPMPGGGWQIHAVLYGPPEPLTEPLPTPGVETNGTPTPGVETFGTYQAQKQPSASTPGGKQPSASTPGGRRGADWLGAGRRGKGH